GYAFAVPSNLVQKIARDLIEFGTVQRGILGVNIREITSDFATEKSLKALEGVWVEAPIIGSAAEEAGLKSGDIILKVNNKNINSVSELQEQIGLYRPGDKLTLLVRRNHNEMPVEVELKNKTGSTQLTDKPTEVNTLLGARFSPLTESELSKYKLKNGVRVEEVTNGKLRMAGVKAGYIITEINGKIIRTVNDITTALNNEKGGFYIGGMYPSGEKVFYSFN
ncbi:MAG: PDZ domain-containing protein, partial [Flavobacteriales bacterium]|nr:PDZ domain-containing protein [Flavobacteriales bacterium]